jgi:hypothetical protein
MGTDKKTQPKTRNAVEEPDGHAFKRRNAGPFLVFSFRQRHLQRRDEARTIGVVPSGGSPGAAVGLARFYFLQ